MVHFSNILITFLRMRTIIFFIKVVLDLKFEHFYCLWPPWISATSEVRWKTSDFIVDLNKKKREDYGVPLSESINFDYLRHYAKFKIVLLSKISNPALQLQQELKCINRGRWWISLLW